MNSLTDLSKVAIVLCFSAGSLPAQERTIDRSHLPAAVEKTVTEQSQGATVKRISTEVEHGKKTYEAELVVNGHTRDIQVAPDGTLTEVEEEIAFDTLTSSVKAGLTRKAAGARITKVEALTKNNKLVAYEAATLRGVKKGEIQVGPDGATLTHAQ